MKTRKLILNDGRVILHHFGAKNAEERKIQNELNLMALERVSEEKAGE